MKAFFVSAFAVCSLVIGQSASACSYVIDEAKVSAELQKVALAQLGDLPNLSSTVKDFTYFESKPTQMCPEEMTFSAVVTASYDNGLNVCVIELAVKKVEPWTELDLVTYTVSGRKSARCKR